MKFIKDVREKIKSNFIEDLKKDDNIDNCTNYNSKIDESHSFHEKENKSAKEIDSVIPLCFSDEIAALQAEELQVLESIYQDEMKILRGLPSTQGDATASFNIRLKYCGNISDLPSPKWDGGLSLDVMLPEKYPRCGVPAFKVVCGSPDRPLGLDEFTSAQRKSLIGKINRQVGESSSSRVCEGEEVMMLMECLRAANSWLNDHEWQQKQNVTDCHVEEESGKNKDSGECHEKKELAWIVKATEEAYAAAARAKLKRSAETTTTMKGCLDDFTDCHHGGVWKYTVGLVGKPSAGKSTFYNAVTRAVLDSRGRKMAEVAPHPFTTIEPNIGPGWYLSPQDEMVDGNGNSRGSCYGRAGVHCGRMLPVIVKDVAGLVPGAYQGRGKGNKFLGDLCDADVLVHVVRFLYRQSPRHCVIFYIELTG